MPSTLQAWLHYIEALHPKTISMGLERVSVVKQRMRLSPAFPIITVAGTNGKGSTCAMLTSIYRQAGYRVATYSSPHILRYNERVCLDGVQVSDDDLCRAFLAVELAREEIELTYFEFGTLAAMWLFMQSNVDVAVLEIGLGGRLDAVNAFEPDCSIITSIDLDHTEYLGNTREEIGYEKAGVYRTGKPAICGDHQPPATLTQHAQSIGANLWLVDHDFTWTHRLGEEIWSYVSSTFNAQVLPVPALAGEYQFDNASCVITAIGCLQTRLPVSVEAISLGLSTVTLMGRYQCLRHHPDIILDVAHNPHAAHALRQNLRQFSKASGKTIAVFSMLADKDIKHVVEVLADSIEHWFVAGLQHPRAAPIKDLVAIVQGVVPTDKILAFESLTEAYRQACLVATENDRIIVFGSFFTVSEVLMLHGL